MKNSIELVKQVHESSSHKTKQYLSTRKKFLNEFKKFLGKYNIDEFQPHKANHFDITGFFRRSNQWFYFSIQDLRWNKDRMLLRTAKSNKDYIGGFNNMISLNSEKEFLEQMQKYMDIESMIITID